MILNLDHMQMLLGFSSERLITQSQLRRARSTADLVKIETGMCASQVREGLRTMGFEAGDDEVVVDQEKVLLPAPIDPEDPEKKAMLPCVRVIARLRVDDHRCLFLGGAKDGELRAMPHRLGFHGAHVIEVKSADFDKPSITPDDSASDSDHPLAFVPVKADTYYLYGWSDQERAWVYANEQGQRQIDAALMA